MTKRPNVNACQDDVLSTMLDSLHIESVTPRRFANGYWVTGTMAGHEFEALVFHEHAEQPTYELGESRISKFHLVRISDRVEVACFERGWSLLPTTREAEDITGLLEAGLAEHIFETMED